MTALADITPAASMEKHAIKQMITLMIGDNLRAASLAWAAGVPVDALASLTERLTKA